LKLLPPLLLVFLLTACTTPSLQHVSGTVTVLETSDSYQVVSVESEATAVAIVASPPYVWQEGRCYQVAYIDSGSDADGTLKGEPRATSVRDCIE
jgi:hypothetical protein